MGSEMCIRDRDIQTFKRAHTMDMKRKSKSETTAAAKRPAKRATKAKKK